MPPVSPGPALREIALFGLPVKVTQQRDQAGAGLVLDAAFQPRSMRQPLGSCEAMPCVRALKLILLLHRQPAATALMTEAGQTQLRDAASVLIQPMQISRIVSPSSSSTSAID